MSHGCLHHLVFDNFILQRLRGVVVLSISSIFFGYQQFQLVNQNYCKGTRLTAVKKEEIVNLFKTRVSDTEMTYQPPR